MSHTGCRHVLFVSFILSVVLIEIFAANIHVGDSNSGFPDFQNHEQEWQRFKSKHRKNYQKEKENKARFGTWLKNRQYIYEHNQNVTQSAAKGGKGGYLLAENHLSDFTAEDYIRLRGYRRSPRQHQFPVIPDLIIPPQYQPYINTIPVSQLPASVNWTANGFVNQVMDQGTCGDCWAFSAAGALEGQYYNVTKTAALLSEQNLLDCSSTPIYGNSGCNGGSMVGAFEYVIDNKGIDAYISYPYTGQQMSTCQYSSSSSLGYITGFRVVKEYDEKALQQAVALIGPISVGINANLPSFQLYSEGVYQPISCSPDQLDHAVLCVGYGTTSDGQDYWLLKNSWGTDWGIQGYMMLARNAGNLCGIATDASFPTGFVSSGNTVMDQTSTGGVAMTLRPPTVVGGPILLVVTTIYVILASLL